MGPNTRRYRKFQDDLNKIMEEYHKKLSVVKKEFEDLNPRDMRWNIYSAEKTLLDNEVHKKVNQVTSKYLARFFS